MKKQAKAEKTPEDLADEFFQEMDVDNDGEVTYEEFRCAAVRNEAILSILSPQPPEWDDKWLLLFLESITENWLLTYRVYNLQLLLVQSGMKGWLQNGNICIIKAIYKNTSH